MKIFKINTVLKACTGCPKSSETCLNRYNFDSVNHTFLVNAHLCRGDLANLFDTKLDLTDYSIT